MKPQSKLTSKEQQENQQRAAEQQVEQTVREFGTVEELLRYDAEQTPVPPRIAERLEESLREAAPPPPRSWWRRFFGP